MTEISHELVLVDRRRTGHPYVCSHDGCGRRLIVNLTDCSIDVIDAGDRYALHHGGSGEVRIGVSVQQLNPPQLN